MKVVVFGATGRAGSRIVSELLGRGHRVRAVVRSANSLQPASNLDVAIDDLSRPDHTAELMRGHDAAVSAYAPPGDQTQELVRVANLLVEAVRQSGVPRLVMVGGAGSLEVAPGVSLIDSGNLPPEWLPIAQAHTDALAVLRASGINWTSLCPAAYFDPGQRTGQFRLGADNLIATDQGESRISMEDYAIALVNELEHPRHERMRFSVGY